MSFEEKYQVERTKWDTLAERKTNINLLLSSQDDFYKYAQRTSTMVGVKEFLGNLHGKRVLELGCGLGQTATLLARSGAIVTSFDLSEASTKVAKKRAIVNRVEGKIHLAVAVGESLPYANERFDIIFGKAILHHLDVKHSSCHIHRVLKKRGKAVFVEPMGMNPLLKFARAHFYYPHKNPHGADHPLTYDDINAWGRKYSHFHYKEIQLLSMLERGLGFNKRLPFLQRLDKVLLGRVPSLRRFCRYVVMFMVK